MPVTVAVSGTGTEIGKTFICCALLRASGSLGFRVVGLKPVESGGGSDGAALADASMFHVKHPSAPYVFEEPVSPHLAARRRDTQIDLATCASWCVRGAEGADLTIIELPGALLTPLSPRATNADLLGILRFDRWILVAPDRLGVLHETRATLLAAESHKLPAPIVALNAPERSDSSTGTNAAELAGLSICAVSASFPRADPYHPSVVAQATQLLRAIGVALPSQPG